MSLTQLDWTQVLRSSYDDATGRLKVDATVVATIGELEVIIRADQGDNIAIASQDGLNVLEINPDGSINANVAVSAAGGDSVLSVGTEDGTVSGIQHVLRVGSDLKLEVKDVTVNASLGSVITNQVTQINQLTTLTNNVSTAANQTNGLQKTQQVDAAGNVQPSADVISRSLFTRLTNGTTEVGITALGEVQVLVTPLTNASVVKSQLQDNAGNGITSQSIGPTRSLDVAVSQTVLAPGSATSALQVTGNTSLNSIDVKLDTTNSTLASIDSDLDVALSTRASSANQTNGLQKTQLVDPGGVSVTSQTNGTQRALDVGINVSGVQIDPRQIRTLTNTDTVTVVQPTGTNLHVVVDASVLPTGAATEATLSTINSKLNTLGQKASADSVPVVIANDQSTINANITDSVTRELGRISASDVLFVSETFNTTSSTLAQARPVNGDLDVRHYKSKTIFIQNTSINDGRYSIFASIDNGVTFDIPVVNNVAINDGVTAVTSIENAYTHLRITARSQTNGQATSFVTKAYAQGV